MFIYLILAKGKYTYNRYLFGQRSGETIQKLLGGVFLPMINHMKKPYCVVHHN